MIASPARASSFRSVRLVAIGSVLALLLSPFAGDACAKSGGGDGGGGGGDQVVIQFLASTGQDVDATARARWRDKGGGVLDFNVELEHLPAGSYDLYVTDMIVPKGSITVDGTGSGEIEFATPQDGGKPLFDFPVFDQVIEVRQAATVFFSDTFSASGGTGGGGGGGGGGNSGDKTKTEVFMVNVGPDFNAQGRLRYEVKGAKTKFSVEVEKLDAGTYTLIVGGAPVGELTTTGPESVEVEFQDPVEAGKTLLNFDPLGAQVDIVRNATTYLTGVLSGSNSTTGTKPPSKGGKSAKDVGKSKGDALLIVLANTGVLSGATATAKLTQSDETELELELEHVPAGAYGFLVGGVSRGTLNADATGHASLNFSTSPGGSVLDLSFAVKGELLEITAGVDVILSTVFPVSVQSALGKFKKETFKSNKVKVNLINAGVDLDATGTVSWKLKSSGDQEVAIDVHDLPAGNYHVVVNTVTSGTALVVSEKGKGKLTFATVAKGSKVLLDFDPVDALVQITDSGNQVMQQALIDVP
jgi:hypothetical protein